MHATPKVAKIAPEEIATVPDHTFCVAPMMDWTDRHERMFLRQFSKRALLYTEMITSAALTHGDAARLLRFSPEEQPVALQIGGSDPQQLAIAARLGEQAGYQEINLNVGCPSDRVQSGAFGACLMLTPGLVARCVEAMRQVVSVPVTVKCRIGVDDHDSYDDLRQFINTCQDAGCETFIIHARKAILSGLSPKENREIPPLHYDRVFAVKQDFPALEIIINGGIDSLAQGKELLQHVDGIMLGRAAYQNPYLLCEVDGALFGESPTPSLNRRQYLENYFPYVESELLAGTPLHHMTRHILGLYKGQPGGRLFRKELTEGVRSPEAGLDVLLRALAHVN